MIGCGPVDVCDSEILQYISNDRVPYSGHPSVALGFEPWADVCGLTECKSWAEWILSL